MQGRMLSIVALSLALAACASNLKVPEPVRKTASTPGLLTHADFEAIPLRTFRSGDSKKDDAAALKLFKDIGHKQTEFLDYMYLFPEKFRLIDAKTTAHLTDELTKKIFASEIGRKSFCFLTSAEEKFIPFYLGVTKKTGKQLRKICTPYNKKLSEAEKHMFRNMRSTLFEGDAPSQRQKRMIFVISESGPMEIEAYSTRENTTLFFLEREAFTETNLVRVLAHELAMSYDQLNRVGHRMNIETWQDGMAVIFGLPLFSRGKGGLYSTHFKKPGNEQAIRCALSDIPVKYALATERAFRFEDKLVAELGLDTNTLGGQNLSCEKNVRRWLPAFGSYANVIEFDLSGASSYLEQYCGEVEDGRPLSQRHILQWEGVLKRIMKRMVTLDDPKRQEFLEQRINTLSSTMLEPKNGKSAVNLCEFLLEPRVGPRHSGFLGGGPRPRAGGWDTKSRE